jgi:hypothetical protein
MNDHLQQPDRLVLRAEAARLFGGVSVRTLKRRVLDGTLPPEIVHSDKVRGWMLSDLMSALRGGRVQR